LEEPRFIVDSMLGNVARWLRMLGYDTLYNRAYKDWKILYLAEKESRIIITRDRGLHHRAINRGLRSLYLYMDDMAERLAFIAYRTGIRLHIDLDRSRCPVCNGELRKVSRAEVKGRVPKKVYELHYDFWECTKCGKIYWVGGHWKGIEETLRRAREILEKMKEGNIYSITEGGI